MRKGVTEIHQDYVVVRVGVLVVDLLGVFQFIVVLQLWCLL